MKTWKMVCLAALIVTAPAVATAEEWILASPYPDSSYVTTNTRAFADDVRKASGGKIDIKVHAGASLYKLPEIKRAVQTRQIAAGEVLLGSMTNEDPIYGIAMMPFLTKDIDDAKRLWAAARPFTEERMAKSGLKLLYITCWPGQSLLTRKSVNSFSDLKGTKFRVQDPNTAELVNQMGATGVRVETADIPQAFLTGIIDGMYTSNETTATRRAGTTSDTPMRPMLGIR
jgi:TRAP-type C4-dicarboxylate transport system substrate-binding protein